jgi:4-hydroxy-tetrahydrodipicolinate synthase
VLAKLVSGSPIGMVAESPTKKPRTNGANANHGPATFATQNIRKLRLMTAVKTPYKEDGNIDLEAYNKHVEHQKANGVEALIIGGTTGEGHLFSWDEHLFLISHTKSRFPDMCVVGNTGSNSTAESVYATKKGFAAGMDCSLLINPYYGKTSTRGMIMHIEMGMDFGPAIIYNVPGRTCQDIPPETIMELAKHKHFVGVKECMGNDRIKVLADKGVACWSGNDDQAYAGRHDFGAVGVISVTANVVPGLFKKLMSEERDDALDKKLGPLYKWLFTEPNPIGVNTMMIMLGACKPVFRMPYTHRSKEHQLEAVKILEEIGLDRCPGVGKVRVFEDHEFKYTVSGD